ncbi:hypothetical protein Droror1_Dr00022575 [Drosera rotundifolia]
MDFMCIYDIYSARSNKVQWKSVILEILWHCDTTNNNLSSVPVCLSYTDHKDLLVLNCGCCEKMRSLTMFLVYVVSSYFYIEISNRPNMVKLNICTPKIYKAQDQKSNSKQNPNL